VNGLGIFSSGTRRLAAETSFLRGFRIRCPISHLASPFARFHLTDTDLLERLRRGDTTAFDSIFRSWYGPLVGTAERMLRDRAVAEELVQDVMLELWRRRESLSPDGSAQAYLFQATRNRVLNHLRHLKIEQRSEPDVRGETGSTPHADAALAHEELDVAVQRAVQALPDRCREVFELSRVHGLKYAEIARTLGISVKTVEAQMGKALRTLRERLAPWLPGEE
jgi:RNA polymerase sigma-70 factor (ECF subfamily)